MKKTILAVMASVLMTAWVMSAHADPTPVTEVSAARVLGTSLHMTHCMAHPDNRKEWSRFSRCVSNNGDAIQRWGHRMDACMNLYRFQSRADDAYTTADPLVTVPGMGLAPADVGGNATLMMVWRKTTFCS